MDSEKVAYLINSTPKYYYILELHLVLLRRYAPDLKWQVFLATEEPEHPMCKKLVEHYDVKLLVLEKENSSFLRSRKRALELLPEQYTMVLPMQEDFLLERYVDEDWIRISVGELEQNENLVSVRYMPCPGPSDTNKERNSLFALIKKEYDTYGFTFQATIWRRSDCQKWYNTIVNKLNSYNTSNSKVLEVDINIAENSDGQKLFYSLFEGRLIVGYLRAHKYPNAVYMCPWPYRPTAIIKGKLQPFAIELAEREGVSIGFQN